MSDVNQEDFDNWFKEFNSWGLTLNDLIGLIRLFKEGGEQPGDTAYTHPEGYEMTVHQRNKWIESGKSAHDGWNAALKFKALQDETNPELINPIQES